MVAERARRGLNLPSTSVQNKLHQEDPYDEEQNKKGYIKLSSADNILSQDLIMDKFRSIDWSKFNMDQLFVYPRGGGELSTLSSVARFINRFCRSADSGVPPVTEDELVVVPGVTTGADLLSQILFDPGDFLLVPSPFYYRFVNDFGERGSVHIGCVPALSEDGTRTELRAERFEEVYQEIMQHQQQGKVRAIMLVNPQNPEAGYFSLDEIRPVVRWALSRNLFVLLDEIYDLSIYDEDSESPFRSAVELFEDERSRQKLIWLWGLSKNFSLPGLRAAVIHSPNPLVRTAITRFMMHHLPNCTTQFIMRQFLDDHEWVERVFLPENLRRMREARDRTLRSLQRMGVRCLKPRAGFFVLADFSKFLDEPTFDGERRLFERLMRNKVIITAGDACRMPTPGWFRIVFTSVSPQTLDEGLNRIRAALTEEQADERGEGTNEDEVANGVTNEDDETSNEGTDSGTFINGNGATTKRRKTTKEQHNESNGRNTPLDKCCSNSPQNGGI
ncbi:hypothetical protein niasHS_011992 [Heterodera schachtii]|uniref:Aminotransferase class I/classII large domain-containing protein n=1 Tax=Heterodera schachtii TaxID=97005 RepID=A0ABD2ICB9_HETSC